MSRGSIHKTGKTSRNSKNNPDDEHVHSPVRAGTSIAPLRTVLLMDDEESILQAYGRLLELNGFSVLTARDGNEALELYESAFSAHKIIDVVVIDLTIPQGMGGIETIHLLKKIDPDVRALVSSGFSQDPILTDYSRYGFVGAIPKPYSWKDLLSAIERVIQDQ
jgi:two-component system cell cycle sensor histidine kinase/response regulator CckA